MSRRRVSDLQHGNNVSDKNPSVKLKNAGYEFKTGIVKEFIDDPDIYFDQSAKLDSLDLIKIRDIYFPNDNNLIDFSSVPAPETILSNHDLIYDMPRSTIFAYIVDSGFSRQNAKPFICYPFFPPHFSLPVKPGEFVWIIKEFSGGVENYYWLCRKHSTKHVDDVNYTHFERSDRIAEKFSSIINNPANTVPETSLRTYAAFDQAATPNLPRSINGDRLVFESVAYKDFTSEPVPPVTRKCGDTLIQGSNNAMIHFTTEKFEKSGNNSVSDFTKVALSSRLSENRSPFSPAIDICVARKKNDLESLKSPILDVADGSEIGVILNKRTPGNSILETFEYNKVKDLQGTDPLINAGLETSALDCGSRIYLSNDCSVDSVFDTVPLGSSLESVAGSSLVTYSDNNRIISNNSLRLTNRNPGSFIDMDSAGNIKIHSKNDIADILNSSAIYLQDGASEPYVRYSELSSLLRKILNDLVLLVELKNILINIIDGLLSADIELPDPLGTVANPFLTLFGPASLLYDDLKRTINAAGLDLEAAEISLSQLTFTEILESPTGEMEAMKSTKIFGE